MARKRTRRSSRSSRKSAAALDVSKIVHTTTYATLGLNAATDANVDGNRTTFRGSLGWQRALGGYSVSGPNTNSAIVADAASGQAFTVTAAPTDQNTAVIQLGADMHLSDQATLSLGYQGTRSTNSNNDAVQANFAWKF